VSENGKSTMRRYVKQPALISAPAASLFVEDKVEARDYGLTP